MPPPPQISLYDEFLRVLAPVLGYQPGTGAALPLYALGYLPAGIEARVALLKAGPPAEWPTTRLGELVNGEG